MAFGAAASCLFAAACPNAARADGFVINPVRVTLAAGRQSSYFVITNGERQAALFQISSFMWTQVGGADHLMPTNDLLAVPLVFAIPPGGFQTVRMALQRPPNASKELTYRIFASQLPTGPARPNVTQVLLRFSIPVFAPPPHPRGAALEWSCELDPGNKLRVTANNRGDIHATVTRIMLYADQQHRHLVAGWNPGAYLLAGQTHSWTVAARAAVSLSELFVESRSIEGVSSATAPVKHP